MLVILKKNQSRNLWHLITNDIISAFYIRIIFCYKYLARGNQKMFFKKKMMTSRIHCEMQAADKRKKFANSSQDFSCWSSRQPSHFLFQGRRKQGAWGWSDPPPSPILGDKLPGSDYEHRETKTVAENWDAICWNYLSLFREYGLDYIFFRNKTFLFFKIESWNF